MLTRTSPSEKNEKCILQLVDITGSLANEVRKNVRKHLISKKVVNMWNKSKVVHSDNSVKHL